MRLYLAFQSYAIRPFLSIRQEHAQDLCNSIQHYLRYSTFKSGSSGVRTLWVECPKARKLAKKTQALDTAAYIQAVQEEIESHKLQGHGIVYTDGSYDGDFAGAGVWYAANHPDNASLPVSVGAQTNNRGELLAFLHVLRTVDRSSPLLIVVDSTYVANGACLWLLGWQASDWRTGSKQVANVDLWAEVAKNLQLRAPVFVMHVYSHIGIEGNEQADRLAKKAVRLHAARRGVMDRPELAVSRRQSPHQSN